MVETSVKASMASSSFRCGGMARVSGGPHKRADHGRQSGQRVAGAVRFALFQNHRQPAPSCWSQGRGKAPERWRGRRRTRSPSGSRTQTDGTSAAPSPFCRRASLKSAAGANTDEVDVNLLSRMGAAAMLLRSDISEGWLWRAKSRSGLAAHRPPLARPRGLATHEIGLAIPAGRSKAAQELRLFRREFLFGENVFLAQLREALNRLDDVLHRDRRSGWRQAPAFSGNSPQRTAGDLETDRPAGRPG